MQVICFRNQPPDGWDERLFAAQSEAGLCQSTFWSRVIRKVDHAEPLFLEVHRDGQTTASLLVFCKLPWDRHKMRRKLGMRELFSGRWLGWLEWKDGPVFHQKEVNFECLALLLDWINNYVRKKRLLLISCMGFAHTSMICDSNAASRVFHEYGYESSKWATYLIDLRVDEDILWRNLKKKSARQAVNKAIRHGVTVRKLRNYDEIENKFYEPFARARSSAGMRPPPLHSFRTQVEEDREKYYTYFAAEASNGAVLAVRGFYAFNGVATNIMSATMPEARKAKIPAQELLDWELIKHAKGIGCRTYDLGGAHPNPTSPKEIGIRNHQKKWGGEYMEYNLYHKDMLPMLTRIGKSVRVMRNRVREEISLLRG
jgi:lipid II:glycine glycyltransferase (peptidoglycan interpeptide bridge formation enzyme)